MILLFQLSLIFIILIAIVFDLIQKDYLLHMAQLSNYRYYEYINWFSRKENINRFLRKLVFIFVYIFLIVILILTTKSNLFSNFNFKEKLFNLYFFSKSYKISTLYLLVNIIVIILNFFLFLISIEKRKKQKKPLVYTKRAIRLKILYSIIYFTFLIIFLIIFNNKFTIYFSPFFNFDSSNLSISNINILIKYLIFLFTFSLIIFMIFKFTPFIMFISQFLILPLEEIINKRYYIMAKKKIDRLKNGNLLIIGITGSYGKTSTKFYIKQVLEKKFQLLASKLSYNTPMGLSKTINDELNENHQIFISEMGARYKNDISNLVNLSKPDIGILTAIGPVHIETFKSIENIIEEKWKIIENSKIGFLNIDNDYIYGKLMSEKKKSSKVTNEDNKDNKDIEELKNKIERLDLSKNKSKGIDLSKKKIKLSKIKLIEKIDIEKINFKDLLKNDFISIFTIGSKKERSPYFLIENINLDEDKMVFDIVINEIIRYNFETKLLGKHSIENLTIAIGIGFLFGLSYKDICSVIKEIEPVEHRLQVIKPNPMLTILDDAFNSNPDSAKAAIDVLKQFADRKKIIVTPGFIELGKIQYQKNKEFGRLISENVDFAIFVGKTNKDALIEGFKSFNNNDKFYYAESLDIASSYLPSLINGKTVVLFENDLPDNYEG